jgi:hypothetical protein
MRKTTAVIVLITAGTTVSTTHLLHQEMAEPLDKDDGNARLLGLAGLAALQCRDRTDYRSSTTTRQRHRLTAGR